MFELPTITVISLFVVWPLWLVLTILYGVFYKEGNEDKWRIL